jgi:hypothetical protein
VEELPDSRGHDDRIELNSSEDKPGMGSIYQQSQAEEKILVQYLEKMINDKKIRPWCNSVGSSILFLSKANVKGHRLCVDY